MHDCEVVKGRGRSRAWWRRAAARLNGVCPAEHADGEWCRQAMACGPMPLWRWEPVPTVDIAPLRDASHERSRHRLVAAPRGDDGDCRRHSNQGWWMVTD